MQEAFARWRDLTAALPENSPGRFPNGWYRFDYVLDGELKKIELHRLPAVIECWLKPADAGIDRPLADAAHCDFWRADPHGRLFRIRGYQEDGQDTFPPRTIFDTTLPIWRLAECILHAQRLAAQLAVDLSKTQVRLRALYTRLSGRVLRAWGNPLSTLMFEGGSARSDEAMLETVIPVRDIDSSLAHHLHPVIASLFERFGVTGLSVDRVAAELERMKASFIP